MLDRRIRCASACFIVCSIGTLIGCGSNPSQISITPSAALVLPQQTVQFTAVGGGGSTSVDEPWQVNGVLGGAASTGTISSAGLYTAPNTRPTQAITISVHGLSGAAAVNFFDPSNISGSVASSQNPLVAQYSIAVPAGASAHVQFGLDTGYGLSTSEVGAPAEGGPTTVLVAGMKASTTYHMQAIIDLIDGSHVLDVDRTFTTAAIPPAELPNLSAQFSGVGTPSPGVELLSLVPPNGADLLSAVATDLQGNVIWYYDLGTGIAPFPIKLLPNGHMLVVVARIGSTGQVDTGDVNEIREVDLAGNIINKITLTDINQALAGVASFRVDSFHHDVMLLPNGHLILLVNYPVTFSDTPGIPPGTVVIGDALIEWDFDKGPVWTWSTFDHLNPARYPYGIVNGMEDWTHANAIIYSPDDGNLIMSLRNQNWIIKIDYANGTGDGSILWRLGGGGDFTLPPQQAPIEWNYGQHYPTIVSSNSSGVFSLMFFNNGNNRLVDSNNTVCGTPGAAACYSSVPVLQLNEFDKTASVLWEDNLLPAYSVCCGDAMLLPNGNTEFDIAADVGTPGFSHIEEVTSVAVPQLVWRMDVQGESAYRGFRIPSLYPGQIWPAATQLGSSANRRKTAH